MPRFPSMGVSAVVDGYRDYLNKVGKMAGETERSHSRISALGRASFGGLVKGAGLAAGAVVGIGAAATGAITAVGSLAAKLAIDATPLVDLEIGFNAIAENAGLVGSEVLAAMKDVSAGTIRAADLMQLFNKGTTLLGENFQDVVPIMDQIIAQGAAIGLEPLQAVQDFTTGVARESKMILDNLGIIVNLEDATTAYAETLGKTKDELTATERQTAILNAAQTSLEKTSKALPGLNTFASTTLAKFKVTMQETRDEIGKALVPAFKELVDSLQKGLGPAAGDMITIFKRDFLPTITEIFGFVGANLPKAFKFATRAFQFFGGVVQQVWRFFKKFVIPGFNFLYQIFVDKILPIVRKVGLFFGNLWELLFSGEFVIKNLKDKLLGMIPPAVFDFIEGLKTKWGEWVTIAKEWWTTHGPDLLQSFTDIKDYIVNEFIPNALNFLATEFEPVIEAAGRLWKALIDQKPNVIAAWEEIKAEALATFGESIPLWLNNLREIWDNLIEIITGDIDDTTNSINTWGKKFIETLGDIVTLGVDVLSLALEGLLQLILLTTTALTGDWARLGELFTQFGQRDRDILGDFGEDIMDALNIAGPSTTPLSGTRTAPIHEMGQTTLAPQPVTPTGGGRIHSEANSQEFNLTINTNAPIEPIVADFQQMAAMARGPQRQ